MNQLPHVTRNILLLNILFFVGTAFLKPFQLAGEWYDPASMLALAYPSMDEFRPYQLVTHMFMHANIQHLFFNMFAVYMFGAALEYRMGHQKFLLYYLICGFGALLLQLGTQYIEINYYGGSPGFMLGASGAVFGLLAGFATYFPEERLMLLFPPIPMKARTFVLLYAALELYLGISGAQAGVAHFAHLGGAIAGFILIYFFRF
jgi:membrane associated rhomboid family serine protease